MDLRRLRDRASSDRGFSLTEMLVVLGIMGVVLAGAYSLSLVVQRSAESSEVQSAFTRDVGTPLQFSEKYLQQNTSLGDWHDNRLECFTDTDLDGLAERVIIEAHADGRLTIDIWNTDLQRDNTSKRIGFEMSTHNTNVANGTPLFVYIDEFGVVIDDLADRPGLTFTVQMNVDADVEGKAMGDSRTIHFRNRS